MRAFDVAASGARGHAARLDNFIPGSRFEDVVRLYVFDKKLRLLALDALERIEMAVRVDVAYRLGQRDARAHENPRFLHGNFSKRRIARGKDSGKTPHEAWLNKYRLLLDRARKEPFVQHHMEQYGALPIWAAVEVWDFGLLSKLLAGMKFDDLKQIASTYGAASGEAFSQWMRSLNFIRNVAAHHSRLWNINVVERSALPPDWPAELDNSRPFFYFGLMQHMLAVICPRSTWGERVANLLGDFPKVNHSAFSVADFGVFPGWQQAEPWGRALRNAGKQREHK
jgi:abortive infection bacteriophage resistance protein